MAEYQDFVDSIADEVKAFEERKAVAAEKEAARETELLQRWQIRKEDEAAREQSSATHALGEHIQEHPSKTWLTITQTTQIQANIPSSRRSLPRCGR